MGDTMKQCMRAIVPAIVILLGAAGCLFVQTAPDTLWTRTYGGGPATTEGGKRDFTPGTPNGGRSSRYAVISEE